MLRSDYTLVGSGMTAAILIDAPGVANEHFRIVLESDEFTLRSCDAKLETLVEGQRVAGRTELKDGQIISVAGVQLVFKCVVESIDAVEDAFKRRSGNPLHEEQQRMYRQRKRERKKALRGSPKS